MLAERPLSASREGIITERLRDVTRRVTGRIVFTTSFGIEDQLIAHHIFTNALPIQVVTLDTGRLFDATLRLWHDTEARYGIAISSFDPDPQAVSALVAEIGVNGFYESKSARLACCSVRKVDPLARALADTAAWVTGLRAGQSNTRAAVVLESRDDERGLLKVSPLFDWTRDQVAEDCAALGIPINTLHAQGFLSIGCEPCTRAIRPGEPERAGRWWWERESNRECGLHVAADGKFGSARMAP